jgi:hypothetical protein
VLEKIMESCIMYYVLCIMYYAKNYSREKEGT